MQAREGAAHFGEYVEDLVAEAQAEVVEERRTAAEATGAPADDGEPAAETEAAAAASKAKTGNGGAPESPNWPPGPGIGGDGDR